MPFLSVHSGARKGLQAKVTVSEALTGELLLGTYSTASAAAKVVDDYIVRRFKRIVDFKASNDMMLAEVFNSPSIARHTAKQYLY